MKNICFFSGDITRGGGTERVSTVIANELAETGLFNVYFLSLTEGAEKPYFSISDKIKRSFLRNKWITPGPGYISIIPDVHKFFCNNCIDVVIDIDIVLDVLSVPASKGLATKVISWEHFNFTFEQKVFYRKIIQRFFSLKTSMIVTLTNRDYDIYRAKYGNKLKITVIPNPIHIKEKENVKKEKWILSAGNLIHVKGTDYLASVAEKVLRENPDWEWHVLGDGELQYMLETVSNMDGVDHRLVMEGRVENVDYFYNKSMMFVLTSRSEGLPMCLLEALGYELPMVSFDIENGPSEIIADGVNGYLITPFQCDLMAEKINDLISSDLKREEFANNSAKRIDDFSLRSTVDRWISLLCSL